MRTSIRIAVNGHGIIGKRVADAVRLRGDMTLAGGADVVTDYRFQTAVELAGLASIVRLGGHPVADRDT